MSMLEWLVSVAITIAVSGGVFAVVTPAQATFRAQGEIVDMQQRLRVGVATLSSALSTAGAGAAAGSNKGALIHSFAPVLPYRQGGNPAMDDGAVRFRPDAITVMAVPAGAGQTAIRGGPAAGTAAGRGGLGPRRPGGAARPRGGGGEGMDGGGFGQTGR